MRRPVRTCVGCRRRGEQAELARCVLGGDGRAVVSRVAPGRGAWLCGEDCLQIAIKRRAFDRAWRRSVEASALAGLSAQLRSGEDGRSEMRDFETRVKG